MISEFIFSVFQFMKSDFFFFWERSDFFLAQNCIIL